MPYRQAHPPSSTARGVRVEWRFDLDHLTFGILGPGVGTFLLVPAIHFIARAPHETWGTVAVTVGYGTYLMLVGLLVGLKHRLVPIEDPPPVSIRPRPEPRVIALKDLVRAFQDEVPAKSSEDL